METYYLLNLSWLHMVTYMFLFFMLKAMDFLWWRPRRLQQHFYKQGIQGPPYHFFMGNLRQIVGLASKASSQPMSFSHNILFRALPFYHHWKSMYGATFLVWFGPTARLTISNPALIQEIFISKSEFFEKNESPPLVRKIEGDGLLTLKGEKWAQHRKIMTPTFYLENIKLMIPIMRKSMGEMMDKWLAMSKSGQVEIEVSECFQILAEEVIMHTSFGSSYQDGRAIFELQAEEMAYATEAFQKIFIPGYRFLPTKKNRIFWRLDKEIRKSMMKLINQRNKIISSHEVASKGCPNDLLELMIKASLNGKNPSLNSSMITARDIAEECKTIFFAGKHTTSNLLTWTTILLAMHPQWQYLARDEVLRVCEARDIPNKDDIAKLKTLGMILNESLRLYPPAVAVIRRAKIDVQLGSLDIPRGTELLVPILAVHHDPELWGHDSNEFNPARFAKGVSSDLAFKFMPFGLGARRCIGQNLAILQAKLAIAMILQRFSFELGPTYRHVPSVLMLLHPQYGAPIILRKL